MHQEPPPVGSEPAVVRLHLHRGIGLGFYGSVAILLFLIVVLSTASSLGSGRFWTAAVVFVVGVPLAAFLGFLALSMAVPELMVTGAGVRGRINLGHPIDVTWDEVTMDVDDARPGMIRLTVGDQSLSMSDQSCVGFREFVVLVGTTPRAAARLTPAAEQEMVRLLFGESPPDR